jgi:hypothetical protein
MAGPKSINRITKLHSISIIPTCITATAANACGFLLTSKSKAPRRQIFRNNGPVGARRFRSWIAVIQPERRTLAHSVFPDRPRLLHQEIRERSVYMDASRMKTCFCSLRSSGMDWLVGACSSGRTWS